MVKYFRGICCEAFGKKHMTLCYDFHKKSIHIVRNGLVKKTRIYKVQQWNGYP